MTLLFRTSRRYLLRHPWLLALSIIGVALGVAVVTAIDLANTSAERAFTVSAETVTGKATHQIVGATGEGLDEDVYRRLRVEAGVRDAAPLIDGFVAVPALNGRTFQLLGIDPLAEGPFRPYLGRAGGLDLGAFMARPGTVLLAAPTAAAFGLALGDTLGVRIDGLARTLTLAGVLEPEDDRSARALDNLMIVDVGTAQELLGMTGRLSRVDLLLPAQPAAEMARIEAFLPAGTEIARSETRTETVAQMTRAFELNLTALSLLALVVGMFLIYNTMTFSVVQRRPLLGRLRALGVTRREVFTLVLSEAAVIGLIGTALGLLLGIVLGRGLVRLVTQTINDLYYVVSVRDLDIAPWTLVKGVALGLGATLVAALFPAREATNAPASTVLQRSYEESQFRDRLPKLSALGVALGLGGGGVLLWPGAGIALSYGGLFLVLMAFALLTPVAVVGLAALVRPLMGRAFGLLGRMAARGVVATLSRTAVAIAALMVALASAIGVGVMVDSFRVTVETWLGYSLQADVYVQPPSLVFRRGDATLDPAVVARLATTEGVEGVYSVRGIEVAAETGRTDLAAIERGPHARRVFRFKEGDPETLWAAFDAPDAVIISEPYSYRHGLALGDSLRLQTDRGPRAFAIVGIFYDYASDLGVVMMARANFLRLFDDRGYSGLALYAAPGQDLDALIERLRTRTDGMQALYIRSNRDLRQASLDIFDRTFTITAVLRLLAVVVAFIGVLSALMALQLERAREFAVLRATGMTPGQLWRYVTLQTGLIGLFAGVLSLPLGLVLAGVLIFVINKRSFGWTLQFEVPPEVFVQALVVALVAALLAGLYPSWRMARANPALALREE